MQLHACFQSDQMSSVNGRLDIYQQQIWDMGKKYPLKSFD